MVTNGLRIEHREGYLMSTRKFSFNLFFCLVFLVACDSNNINEPNPNANSPDSLATKIIIPGASVLAGKLPEASLLASAPSVKLTDPTSSVLFSSPGSTVNVPLQITIAEGSFLQAILAKLGGSSSFFQILTNGSTSKQSADKALVSSIFSLKIGADFPADSFCMDITAVDNAQRVSAPQSVCIGLPGNNPLGPQPLANPGPDQTVRGGTSVQLVGSGSSPGAAINSFSWTQLSGASLNLNGANSSILSFTAPNIGQTSNFSFRLSVSDSQNRQSSADVNVQVLAANAQNEAPIAEAGPDQTVDGGLQVSLRGDSFDVDGVISGVLWSQIDGPTVNLTGATSPTAQFLAPADQNSDTNFQFRFQVTDDDAAQSSDTTTITVRAGNGSGTANNPPIANAGPDQNVLADSTVTLSGGGSSDPDGNIASYAWTQSAGPQVALNNANSVNPSFTAPGQIGAQLTFQLTVTDNLGASANDSVTVTIQQTATARDPVASAGPDQNALAGSQVQLSGTDSFNPDGGNLTYAWSQTGGPQVVLNQPNTVNPSFVAPQAAAGTVLSFVLSVTNNVQTMASDQVDITIVATAPTPAPVHKVGFADAAQNASEGAGTVNLRLTIQPAASQNFSLPFSISGSASSGADFSASASPLQIAAGLDQINLTVNIVDDAQTESDETVIVTLGDPSSGQLDSITQHTLTIIDNDVAGAPQRELLATTDEYQLLRFNSANLSSVTVVDITGIAATGQDNSLPLILDMDRRPASGEIFLLTSDQRLYLLNASTGVASLHAMIGSALGQSFGQGMSFNPCTDQIRLLGSLRENFRLQPDGSLVAVDSNLSFGPGDVNEGSPPTVDSIAYTGCQQSQTTAFVIDTTIDILTTLGSPSGSPQSPNGGRVFTIGALGQNLGGAGTLSLDIFANDTRGFAADSNGTNTDLLAVDLATGAVTNLGRIVTTLTRSSVSTLMVLQ